MKRRTFLGVLGGAAVGWPLAARAQQAAIPVVGFLTAQSFDVITESLRVFRQGLKDTGILEGENVAIEYRSGVNQADQLPALAAELARRRISVIAAIGLPPALAAKAATTTIPIVFNVGDDPVRHGLVASLARPDGNLTGINFFSVELAAKRLELLRELVPAAIRVGVLVNPANVTVTESTLRDVEPAARKMGLQIQLFNADTSREINAVLIPSCVCDPRRYLSGPALLQFPACSIDPTGGAPHGPCDLSGASICRSRRTDKLRSKPDRYMASVRRLRRSHPQRGQAGRLAGSYLVGACTGRSAGFSPLRMRST
jgi:hypothetical protein